MEMANRGTLFLDELGDVDLQIQAKLLKADFKAPGFPDKEWKSEWVKPPAPTVTRTSAPAK